MKVVATGYQQERVILEGVDQTTASMTASVLNELQARKALEAPSVPRELACFYSAQPDTYELKS